MISAVDISQPINAAVMNRKRNADGYTALRFDVQPVNQRQLAVKPVCCRIELTLGVGRCLAGALETGLLPFLDTCIPGKETTFT
jgi:hypothetical protein